MSKNAVAPDTKNNAFFYANPDDHLQDPNFNDQEGTSKYYQF